MVSCDDLLAQAIEIADSTPSFAFLALEHWIEDEGYKEKKRKYQDEEDYWPHFHLVIIASEAEVELVEKALVETFNILPYREAIQDLVHAKALFGWVYAGYFAKFRETIFYFKKNEQILEPHIVQATTLTTDFHITTRIERNFNVWRLSQKRAVSERKGSGMQWIGIRIPLRSSAARAIRPP